MKRFLTTLALTASCLLTAPAPSEAGVIPWVYDSIFGVGPRVAARYSMYGPAAYPAYTPTYGYSAGYAPAYYGGLASYGYGYSGYGYSQPYLASYAPGWDYSGSCCNPCSTGCDPCGSGCAPCAGGSCAGCSTGSTSTPPADDTSNSVQQRTPTFADPDNRNQPGDDSFERARQNLERGNGSSAPQNDSSIPGDGGLAPEFGRPAPAEPGGGRTGDPDARMMPPVAPINLDAKVAFTAPAKFSRVRAEPRFRLPTSVQSVARVHHDAPSTVVASK